MIRFTVAIGLAALTGQSSAQLWDSLVTPRVEVSIDHPAGLPLRVSTVALAEPEGKCAESVLGRIEADFVQNGIAVVDRARLNQVLQEQKLQVSGLVDERSATNVGQLLGAQALVFLKILDCQTSSRTDGFVDSNNQRHTKYITVGAIQGTLRVVDLTTGRVIAAESLDESTGYESPNSYPDRNQTLAEVENEVAGAVHRLFMPWREVRNVVFYSDRDCNLKVAHDLLRAADLEGALEQSAANVAACRDASGVRERTIGRSYYNLGMVQYLAGEHDAAIASLSEAMKYQSGDIVTELLVEIRAARRTASTSITSAERGRTASPASSPTSAPTSAPSIAQRLEQLQSLREQGLISQQEFDSKRNEILGTL
jgi:hypothetical protein